MTCTCNDKNTIYGRQGAVCKYEELYYLMLPYLPSCPQALVLQELRHAGRRLCNDSESWQEYLNPTNLKEGVKGYELTFDWCAEIVRIEKVEIRTSEQVSNKTTGDILKPCEYLYEPYNESTGIEDYLELVRAPQESIKKGLIVKATLIPQLYAEALPKWYMNRWGEAIVGAAMHSLLTMKDKKWTDMARAEKYGYEYRKGWTKSMNEKEREFKNTDITMSA